MPRSCFPVHGSVAAVVLLSLSGALAAEGGDAAGIPRLPGVTVEAEPPAALRDATRWARDVRAALARAERLERAALSARDRAQILILPADRVRLEEALRRIERLARKVRLRQVLTASEQRELVRQYALAEAILENVPDAFIPRCVTRAAHGRRNRVNVCTPDGDAQRALWARIPAWAVPALAPPGSAAVPPAADPRRPDAARSPRAAHALVDATVQVRIDERDHRPGRAAVAWPGDVIAGRRDYVLEGRAGATLRPSHRLRLSLPPAFGATLEPDDALRVLGAVALDGERRIAAQVPRASFAGFALLIREDGGWDGAVATFEYGWSERRRFRPWSGVRATFAPASVRLLPSYDGVAIAREPFTRWRLDYDGADGRVARFTLHRFAAPPPAEPIESHRISAAPGSTSDLGPVRLAVIELTEERLRYRILDADAPPSVGVGIASRRSGNREDGS